MRERRGEHLEGDLAPEADVLGEIDDAHSTAAEQGLDPVAGKYCPDASSFAHAHMVLTARVAVVFPRPACRITGCRSRLARMHGREGSFGTCLMRGRRP